MKQKLIDWYDRKIVAGWYRSSSLIVGWLVSAAIFAPDLLQFIVDHWDVVGAVALPTLGAEWKALILALYVNFGAPWLRAWRQKKMQELALKQAVKVGEVTSLPFTTEVKVNIGEGSK